MFIELLVSIFVYGASAAMALMCWSQLFNHCDFLQPPNRDIWNPATHTYDESP